MPLFGCHGPIKLRWCTAALQPKMTTPLYSKQRKIEGTEDSLP